MSNELASTDASPKKFVIDFIDPLFAIAIAVGFTEGIMTETWFGEWRPPEGDEWFRLWSFLLGFLTLFLSWVGYHQSIRDKPLRGLPRFYLDVILVMSYALMLVQYRHFGWVLGILVFVFLVFILWDWAKVEEYRQIYEAKREAAGNPSFGTFYHREIVTAIWFVLFGVLFLGYAWGPVTKDVALVGAIAGTFLYRLHKRQSISQALRQWVRGSAST